MSSITNLIYKINSSRIGNSLSKKIARKLAYLTRKTTLRFYDPIINFDLAKHIFKFYPFTPKYSFLTPDFKIKFSHNLGRIYSTFPLYSSNAGRIAGFFDDPKYLIIDIGANIGDTIIHVRMDSSATVLSIDGNEYFTDVLKHNASFFENVYTHISLLSDEDEISNVSFSTTHGTATLLESKQNHISSSTLDKVYYEHYADKKVIPKVIKIDTDGYDLKVLRGCNKLIEDFKPILFFEFDPQYLKNIENDIQKSLNWFAQKKYTHFIIYDNIGLLLTFFSSDIDSQLKILYSYVDQKKGMYFDICCFHESDKTTFETFLNSEINLFQNLTSNE